MHIVDLEIALDHDDLTEIRGGFFFALPVYLSSVATATTFPSASKEPAPGGFEPVPYPNTGKTDDTPNGHKPVKIKKH